MLTYFLCTLRLGAGHSTIAPALSELSANLLEGSRGSVADFPPAISELSANLLEGSRGSAADFPPAISELSADLLEGSRGSAADFPPAISELSADLLSPLPSVGAGACLPSSFGLFFPRLNGA